MELRNIINQYKEDEKRINMDKAEITVSPNIGVEMQRELSDMLGVKAIYQHSKYLGLPTLIGQSKYDGKNYQEDERLEGEVFITGRQSNTNKNFHSIHSFLCHELFSIPHHIVPRSGAGYNEIFLGLNN